MTMKFITVLAVLAGILLSGSPVEAQSSNAVLSAKVEVLERQVRMLRSRLGMNPPASVEAPGQAIEAGPTGPANPALVADLSVKMGSLEAQIRKLTGRLEEYEYHQRQLKEEIDILRKDLELQRRSAEQPPSTMPATTPQTAPASNDGGEALAPVEEATPTTPVIELPAGDAAAQYDYAFAFVRKNDLASGQVALEKFLEANPNDNRVGYAKFWLGRIHVLEGRNAQAAQYLLSLIEDHPNHERRPDALVELADVLIKLDAAGDACNALSEFSRMEDKASPRMRTRAERLSATARCG